MSEMMRKSAKSAVSLCENNVKDTFFEVSFFACFRFFYYYYFMNNMCRKVKTAVIV